MRLLLLMAMVSCGEDTPAPVTDLAMNVDAAVDLAGGGGSCTTDSDCAWRQIEQACYCHNGEPLPPGNECSAQSGVGCFCRGGTCTTVAGPPGTLGEGARCTDRPANPCAPGLVCCQQCISRFNDAGDTCGDACCDSAQLCTQPLNGLCPPEAG
jgi:hypothetical protein